MQPGEVIDLELKADTEKDLALKVAELEVPCRRDGDRFRVTLRAPAAGTIVQAVAEKQVGPLNIEVLGPTVKVAETKAADTICRSGPDAAYDRYLPLTAGVRAEVSGRQGNWIRLAPLGGWVHLDDVELSQQPLGPIFCRSAAVEGQTLKLNLTARCAVQTEETEDGLLLILPGVGLAMGEVAIPTSSGRIREARFLPGPRQMRIRVVLADGPLCGYRVEWAGSELRVAFKPPLPTTLRGVTVVVDAGHGGEVDPGAIGAGGMKEKDLNLKVARATQKALEQAGATVVMTRQDDRAVAGEEAGASAELAARVELGRAAEGDLFLSIHHNAKPLISDARVAHGTDIYYYHPQSRELARALADPIADKIGEPDRRYLWRSFHVMRQTDMPAVLLELNYISNPKLEREMLAQPGYPQRAAQAIVDGVSHFLKISQ